METWKDLIPPQILLVQYLGETKNLWEYVGILSG